MQVQSRNFLPRALLPRLGLLAAGALLAACAGPGAAPGAGDTTVYLLRHAEPDLEDPDRPLVDRGRARAERLVKHLAGVPVTHVCASHTDRTRDTVAPLARARGLEVKQFPRVGGRLDGKIVDNRTPGAAAIEPLIAAIRALPPGATAVVAGNGGNLYPVIAGLGAGVDASCTAERTDCLPCGTRKCFDAKRFDFVWKVVIGRDGTVSLSRSTYGN